MKKVLAIFCLVAILTLSLVSCGNKTAEYSLGVGIYASTTATNADGEVAGAASVAYTMAAVLLDKDGKVVNCVIDASNYGDVAVSANGATTIETAMTTKQTLGNDYGMSAAGKTEWFEQANAFAASTKGKTIDGVKALMDADYKGT